MLDRMTLKQEATFDFSEHQGGCSCAECMAGDASKQTAGGPTFADDIVPGNLSSTATVAVGGSVVVSIDTLADRDWYRVNLTAGVTYTIQTSANGAATDAFLRIRNSAGTELASDDDSGDAVNSLISFTPTTSGVYYIDAGTYNDETTGTYHLFVAEGVPAGDFVAGTTATGATLAVSGTVNGNIDSSGDHDFYAINLVAGQTYMFRTSSTLPLTGTSPAGAVDTILTLRDSSGAQLATNDDAGEYAYSAIRFTATTTGTYYLDVSGFGTATGAFNLTAFPSEPLTLYTNDQIATQLTTTYWGGTTRRWNVAPGGTITVNITALTADGIALVREALNLWTDVTGINFSEVTTGGQMVFDDNQAGAFANSVRTGGIITSATVNVETQWLTTYGTGLNTYSFQTYVHEIGHALGLGHGGPYNGSADYATDASYLNDAWATTIMSYFDQTENTYFGGLGYTRQFAVSPMVADIVATTNLYGTPTTTRTGNTTYGFNNNSGRAIYTAVVGPTAMTYTVVDHGGVDTLDYSGYSANQRINLNEEKFSNIGGRVGNVSIARGTVIENAIGGTGSDIIIGNGANNHLSGGSGTGNDLLFGGGGTDTLDGGQGNDSYFVDTGDVIIELAAGGYDVAYADSNYVLGSMVDLEVLATVNELATTAINLTGNELNNYLSGNAGVNILDGGTGSDILWGRGGDDVYFADANDLVVEYAGQGNDRINARESFILYDGIEVETLAAADAASTAALNLTGNAGNNRIIGNAGANILNGGGGSDTFEGGLGDDSYYNISFDDTVIDGIGNGYDIVYTSGNFTLLAGVEIEVVGTTDNLAATGINLTGNELNNYLTGNGGVNILNGAGGSDYLGGRGGNDIFVFGASSGADTILDFTRGQDRIDLSALGLSFAQVQAGYVQQGIHGVINLGSGNSVTLLNVTLSELTSADFILTAAAEVLSKESAVSAVLGVTKAFETSDADLSAFSVEVGIDRMVQPLSSDVFVM